MATRLGDHDLLTAALGGDRAAAIELWRRHSGYGLAVAQGLVPEDDWQSINTRAWATVLTTPDDRVAAGFRPYLYLVIRAISSAEERPEGTEAALTAAYRALPPRWREVLWLSHIDLMKPPQIAVFTGLAEAETPQVLHRARQGLRREWTSRQPGVSSEGVTGGTGSAGGTEADAIRIASDLRTVVLPTVAGTGGAATLLEYLRTNGPCFRGLTFLPPAVDVLFPPTSAAPAEPATPVRREAPGTGAGKEALGTVVRREAPATGVRREAPATADDRGSTAAHRKTAARPEPTVAPRESAHTGTRRKTGVGTTPSSTDDAFAPVSRNATAPSETSTSTAADPPAPEGRKTRPREVPDPDAARLVAGAKRRDEELPEPVRPEDLLLEVVPPEPPVRRRRGWPGTVLAATLVVVVLAIIALTSINRPAPEASGTPEGTPRLGTQILTIDTGPDNTVYPVVSGTARPGATVTVEVGGATIEITADGTGQWTTAGQPLSSLPERGLITAAEGTEEPATAMYALAPPPAATVADTATGRTLTITGVPTTTVDVILDGQVATTITLDAAGTHDLPLPPGTREVQTRYILDARVGPTSPARPVG